MRVDIGEVETEIAETQRFELLEVLEVIEEVLRRKVLSYESEFSGEFPTFESLHDRLRDAAIGCMDREGMWDDRGLCYVTKSGDSCFANIRGLEGDGSAGNRLWKGGESVRYQGEELEKVFSIFQHEVPDDVRTREKSPRFVERAHRKESGRRVISEAGDNFLENLFDDLD